MPFPVFPPAFTATLKKEAAETAVVVAGQFLLTECPNTEVIFCVFDDETRGIYEGLLGKSAEDAEIWQ